MKRNIGFPILLAAVVGSTGVPIAMASPATNLQTSHETTKAVQPNAAKTTRGNGIGKLVVLTDLLKDLGVKPDPKGRNPYTDVSASHWGYVHVAVERGWVKPDSAKTFGSNDTATVAWVDSFYWNYCGITHAQYQPGGYPWAWANIYGLNRGMDPVANVTNHDLVQLAANLKAFQRGWWYADGEYHLSPAPLDWYVAFYNPRFPVPASSFQKVVRTSIQVISRVTIRPQSDYLVMTFPSIPDPTDYQYVLNSTKKLSYSFDNGQSWKESTGFFTNVFKAGGKVWGDTMLSQFPVIAKIPSDAVFGVEFTDSGNTMDMGGSQYGVGLSFKYEDGQLTITENRGNLK
ncbi:MAG: hypothetical protein K6T83_00195 [Alicyclobacillus sp.]|nr:hypothetical protein [Alicyclobacillus sp.]